MKKQFIYICVAWLCISCSSRTIDSSAEVMDLKIQVKSKDVFIDNNEVNIPIDVQCIPGYKIAVLQIGDAYKTFSCGQESRFSYTHKFPKELMKENREKKKNYVLRVRVFHEEHKAKTISQLLMIISYKDYQSQLEINQSVVGVKNMDGIFSDVTAHGLCSEGSTVEIEIFDDWRGVSLEEVSMPCSETGFHFASRRHGTMKKGMRLLIRQMKGEKAVSSYEVVLFN